MPNYRRVRDGRTYFFTVVTHRRRPILCDKLVRSVLRDKLMELRRHRPFRIDAWVLMPDHLHCVWTLPVNDRDYTARWGWLKKEVTKTVNEFSPRGRVRRTLWQRRFWEHRVRDRVDLHAHYDYIHYNPVRHGLVDGPADWPWSSVHRFIADGIYPVNWAVGGIETPPGIGRE
jgi:putative transposase